MSKLDASFAITTVESEQIREIAPLSTADLFKVTPGVWAESSGGESGANVMVEDYPAMKEGRFYGFRLKALNPDWAIDLRPGDVIVRVNGQVIEHPEEADAALRSLEKAAALKIDYERDGKMKTLELPIVD